MATFEKRLEGTEGASQVTVYLGVRGYVSGKETASANTRREETGLVYSRDSKGASVAGVEREESLRNEVQTSNQDGSIGK